MGYVETSQVTTMWQDKGADKDEKASTKKARLRAIRVYWYPKVKNRNRAA